MSLKQRLEDEIKTAMKARDASRLACLRMLKSRVMEREVALRAKQGRDYTIAEHDDEVQGVIAAYAKQRRDSIDSYRQGGRDELAAAEQAELAIVSEFLPVQLSEDDVRDLVKQAIADSGATSAKDLGAVMKAAMPLTQGKADGKLVNRLARELLE